MHGGVCSSARDTCRKAADEYTDRISADIIIIIIIGVECRAKHVRA